MNKRAYIVRDILLLSTLVVEGYGVWGQRFEDGVNIKLRTTGGTNVEVWEAKVNKFIYELKHLFSRRWNTTRKRTLIDCVHDDVGRTLRIEGEDFLEARYHGMIIGLPNSAIVSRIESGEDVTAGIRPG